MSTNPSPEYHDAEERYRAAQTDEERLVALQGMLSAIPKHKEPAWDKPFTLPRGSTVEDLARHIHKDLANNLRWARIWGQGYHDGMRVPRDHVLHDMDVIEISA